MRQQKSFQTQNDALNTKNRELVELLSLILRKRDENDHYDNSIPRNTDFSKHKIQKVLDLLPKLTMLLNAIKKIIALFSTVFMIDCKLTGEGHFGIECVDQVHVISVDNSFGPKPFIYQNGREVSIIDLNDNDECFLPLCSCIHPSKLRWYKLKNPELYDRCFTDQCNNQHNICLNKPNNSKCMLRNRMCIDFNRH